MPTMIIAAAGLAAALASPPAVTRDMYAETMEPGRQVDGTDTVLLCGSDDAGGRRAMLTLARAAMPGAPTTPAPCIQRLRGTATVVQTVGDVCLRMPGVEWCEVEAHLVRVRHGGRIRQAVLIVTAAQLD